MAFLLAVDIFAVCVTILLIWTHGFNEFSIFFLVIIAILTGGLILNIYVNKQEKASLEAQKIEQAERARQRAIEQEECEKQQAIKQVEIERERTERKMQQEKEEERQQAIAEQKRQQEEQERQAREQEKQQLEQQRLYKKNILALCNVLKYRVCLGIYDFFMADPQYKLAIGNFVKQNTKAIEDIMFDVRRENLSEEITKTEKCIKDVSKGIDETEKRIEELPEEIAETTNEIKQYKKEKHETLVALKEKRLKRQKEKLKEQKESLKKQNEQLEKLEEYLKTLKEEYSILKSNFDTFDELVKMLTNALIENTEYTFDIAKSATDKTIITILLNEWIVNFKKQNSDFCDKINIADQDESIKLFANNFDKSKTPQKTMYSFFMLLYDVKVDFNANIPALNKAYKIFESRLNRAYDTIQKTVVYENFKGVLFTHIDTTKGGESFTIDDIDGMDGTQFEQYISKLFEKMGYETEVTKHSGDQGIDVIAKNDIVTIGIQAKCYSSTVGNSAVQEAVGGKALYKVDKVMVITNNEFTPAAKQLAKANNVELWDRHKLIEKVSQYEN